MVTEYTLKMAVTVTPLIVSEVILL